ncbi:13941_t:CDS:1, partial [Cetraspora pellucida]
LAFEWFLKSTQRKCEHSFFVWMEYDNFRNIEEVGKGEFSIVYKTSYKNRYQT